MKNIDEVKEICAFLEKKLAHVKQYLSITEKIKQAFENKKEFINFGGMVSLRQGLVNKIDKIDMSTEKIFKKGSPKLSHISNKYKDMIDGYIIKIRDVMTTVDLMDKEIMMMAKQEVELAKTEVIKTQNFRQAARGYSGGTGYTARFLDTRR